MKKFIANVVDIRHINFAVLADSKKEAVEKVRDILENTDLVENTDAEFSTAFKVIDADEDCDEDDDDMDDDECEGCIYKDEDECLLDELY